MLVKFLRSRSGAVGVAVAVAAPILIGGLGLGAESGYHHVAQRLLQNAADVAAYAAAASIRLGEGRDGQIAAARSSVDLAGAPSSSLHLASPPAAGTYAGRADAVEVTLSEDRPRLFSRIFVEAPVRLRARAVARIADAANACVLALSPNAPGALTTAGSALVRLKGCDLASNSNASNAFDMLGAMVQVEAGCATTVGQADVTGGLLLDCAELREFAPPVVDPYADTLEPALEGPCSEQRNGNTSPTALMPDHAHSTGAVSLRLCGGLTVTGAMTLSPGLYLIDGDLDVAANGSLSGSDVTFFVTGSVRMTGTPDLALSAPSIGPYSGMLFFGARGATGSSSIRGDVGSMFSGAIYFPDGELELSGSAGSSGGCQQVIARTITFTGNGIFDLRCDTCQWTPSFTS